MSREIKFRAWDKNEEKMVNWDYLIGYCDIDYLFGNLFEPNGNKRDTVPDFDVMQYTGLKDKNGKEIYEGDIVDIVTESDNFSEEFTRYINTKFSVSYDNDSYAPALISNTCKHLYHLLDEVDSSEIEVIGNIHENPELVKSVNNE